MKAKFIESPRLKLHALSLQYLSESYLGWLNDNDVFKYMESGGDYTYSQLKIFLKNVEESNIYFWAICLKDSNKHIGNIKIDPINSFLNSGEYGIMIGEKSEWGKGYAEEASKAVIDFCFSSDVGLSSITLGVLKENVTAIRLYRKLGFSIDEKLQKEMSSDVLRFKLENKHHLK